MNIYLLTQSKCHGYDTFDSCVVSANSEEEAKLMHPDGGDIASTSGYVWPTKTKHIEAELIGCTKKTDDQETSRVICASFNAG